MMRSSESICANMSEGFYSQYSIEYLQSLYRCRKEARETKVHIHYAIDVGQLNKTDVDGILTEYDDGLKQLNNLISSIERKIQERGKAKPVQSIVKDPEEPYTINHQP